MGNKTVKALLCLLMTGAVFASIGCAGRAADRDGQGSADQATPTPTPAPSSTPQPMQGPASPSPTAQPSGASNYTTTLGLDDVSFSGGDQEYGYPEDALPTPEMPQ